MTREVTGTNYTNIYYLFKSVLCFRYQSYQTNAGKCYLK
jgi:hypothetical protein